MGFVRELISATTLNPLRHALVSEPCPLSRNAALSSKGTVEVRNNMNALQKRLADDLARVDEELRDIRSQESRYDAAAAATAAAAQQNVRFLRKVCAVDR